MINKIVQPCFVEVEGRNYPAYARIKFDGKRLSITGVVGPMRNGNCKGGCGQCVDSMRNGTPATGWDVDLLKEFCHVWDRWHLNDMRPYCQHQKELGWDKLAGKRVTLYTYLLTDEVRRERRKIKEMAMSALLDGATVQLSQEDIELLRLKDMVTLPEPTTDERYRPSTSGHFPATETSLLGHLTTTQHPDGLVGKACPICGYKYGSDWLTEEVPQDVIEFLEGLPESDTRPAWV